MHARLLLLVLLTFAASAQAEDDYSALIEAAIEAIDWDFVEDWAFTRSALHDGEVWVGRYDPRVDIDDGWKLISVAGREPTSGEVREFLHSNDERQFPDDSIASIAERDSLELIEETDEQFLFSFVPDADETEFVDSVDATVTINKEGPYIELIEMRNHSDIKPGFGTRLTTFLTQFSFGPAAEGGPIVPKGFKVQVVGRALLFIAIDETEAVQYSDFEYAGDQKR